MNAFFLFRRVAASSNNRQEQIPSRPSVLNIHPDVQNSAALLPYLIEAGFWNPVSYLITDVVYTGKVCNDSTCPMKWMFLALLDRCPLETAVSH